MMPSNGYHLAGVVGRGRQALGLLIALGLTVFLALPIQGAAAKGPGPNPTPAGSASRPLTAAASPRTQEGHSTQRPPAAVAANASGTWTWQNPRPEGNPLFAISCPTANTCFAAGQDSAILYTANGGSTWAQQSPAKGINAISCPSATECVAVGDFGLVMTTSNAGTTWASQTINGGSFLAGVSCPSTAVCFAVGYAGSILGTANGAATWTAQNSTNGSNLFAIDCPTVATCIAVGNALGGGFVATTNGGATWSVQSINGFIYVNLFGIACSSTTSCVAVGGGQEIVSGQPGALWIPQAGNPAIDLNSVSCETSAECLAAGSDGKIYYIAIGGGGAGILGTATTAETGSLFGISCATSASCFAAGDAGIVVATSDGGNAWTKQSPGNFTDLHAITCTSATACIAVGEQGIAAATADGGTTWSIQNVTSSRLLGISCPTASTCFAVGAGVFVTTNGGQTWTKQTTPGSLDLHGVSCASATSCVAVGSSAAVITTSNGGATWTSRVSGLGAPVALLGVSCPSTSVCFAAATDGHVLATTNSGVSWTPQGSNTVLLNGISCTSTTVCTAVGGTLGSPDTVRILTTTDGGSGWNDHTPAGAPFPFNAVSCVSSTVCFAGGGDPAGDGEIYATTDGATWLPQTTPSPSEVLGLACASASTCFSAGAFGVIQGTTNGGATWQFLAPSGTQAALTSISCPSTTVCFAVGYDQVIKTTNGGSVWSVNLTSTTYPRAISCPSTAVCIAVGQSAAIATVNGGTSWASTTLTHTYSSLSCPTVTVCFAASIDGFFAMTTNGGTTWSTPAQVGTAAGLSGISCPSTSLCFATDAATPGQVFTTSNSGTSWSVSFNLSTDPQAGNSGPFQAIDCPATSECFAAGASGLVATTTDGGAHWRTDNIPSTALLTGVSCPTASTCFVSANDATILHTADFGSVWDQQFTGGPVAGYPSLVLAGISCPTTTSCFVAGAGGLIRATTQSGAAWSRQQPAGPIDSVYAMSCTSPSDCYAAAGANFLVTHDGGSVWTASTPSGTDFVEGITCPATGTCFAVGWPGAIYETTDAGVVWNYETSFLSGADQTLLGVSCSTASNCVAVGTQGTIISTADGTHWAAEPSGTQLQLSGVSCADSSTCVAVGLQGLTLTRTAGTWQSHASGTTQNLYSVSCPGATICYAVGAGGTLMYTASRGTTWAAQASGTASNLLGVSCVQTAMCIGVGNFGTAVMTLDGSSWSGVGLTTFNRLRAVAFGDINHVWVAGFGGTILANPALTPGCATVTASPPAASTVSSTQQYALHGSNGVAWQEIDAVNLRIACTPTSNEVALLTANADLWTANAGYNQDFGIFASDNGGADQLLAWKESGGFAGTFSPNAAYVQGLFNMTSGHTYVFKLKWKTNKNAPAATIFAGAGGGLISPTSLIAEVFPTGAAPTFAVATKQYQLPHSDGVTWQSIDDVSLSATLSPVAAATAVLGGSVDLWTANPGYNQDIGIFVSDNGGADTLVAWKESGGFAGTFSPNAAFVKSTFAMAAGHTYVFKLKWKTNKSAAAATIFAGAGPIGGFYSPTSLLAETIAAGPNPYTAVSTSQYALSNSDGVNWQPIDAALNVTVSPLSDTNSILGANIDLFTAKAGYNQDIGIFVSDNGGADQLVAWKESGGFAGTFSPNAAFVQATYHMIGGHTYVFKVKWKTNKNAAGASVYAGAGSAPAFSPTRLTVELTG